MYGEVGRNPQLNSLLLLPHLSPPASTKVGIMSLDDNIIIQILSFAISCFIVIQWVIASIIKTTSSTTTSSSSDNNNNNNTSSSIQLPHVPLVNGNGLTNTVGTILLSIASAYVVPSFVNLRVSGDKRARKEPRTSLFRSFTHITPLFFNSSQRKELNIQKTMWSASFITTALYILVGAIRKY